MLELCDAEENFQSSFSYTIRFKGIVRYILVRGIPFGFSEYDELMIKRSDRKILGNVVDRSRLFLSDFI